jgi:hypothetical protein
MRHVKAVGVALLVAFIAGAIFLLAQLMYAQIVLMPRQMATWQQRARRKRRHPVGGANGGGRVRRLFDVVAAPGKKALNRAEIGASQLEKSSSRMPSSPG